MLVNQNHECEFAQGKSFRVKLWNLWKVITPRKAIYGTADCKWGRDLIFCVPVSRGFIVEADTVK